MSGCRQDADKNPVAVSRELAVSTKPRANSCTGLRVADDIPQHHCHHSCASHYNSICCLVRKMEKEGQNAHPKTEGQQSRPKREGPPREGSTTPNPEREGIPTARSQAQPQLRARKTTLSQRRTANPNAEKGGQPLKCKKESPTSTQRAKNPRPAPEKNTKCLGTVVLCSMKWCLFWCNKNVAYYSSNLQSVGFFTSFTKIRKMEMRHGFVCHEMVPFSVVQQKRYVLQSYVAL